MPSSRKRLRSLLPLSLLCALTACQQPAITTAAPATPRPVNGVGYLLFNAPITNQSRDLFIADVDKLVGAGANEIAVGINSPGGATDAAQGIVEYMQREHAAQGITFRAYDVGVVASAATYVFLNAQARYSAPRGTFVFHAAGLLSNGLVSAERLREVANQIDSYERLVLATMKTRTHLTDAEASTYLHRTVVLSSDDARRDGIIDAIADFTIPKGAVGMVITTVARKPGTPATTPPSATPPTNTPG